MSIDIGEGEEIKSENSLFTDEDKSTCLKCIEIITSGEEKELSAAVEKLIKTLEKYQEQSNLIHSSLPQFIDPIMEIVRSHSHKHYLQIEKDKDSAFPFQKYKSTQLHACMQVIYLLCRVCKMKKIIKFLPHEVADLEPCFIMLQSQDRLDYSSWEIRYSFLLWLAILVLIPFDLNTVDSNLKNEEDGVKNTNSLISSIISLLSEYLSDSGACRDIAATCLARLLTRPDMEGVYLTTFISFADVSLKKQDEDLSQQFLKVGILSALSEIFKRGHRSTIVSSSILNITTSALSSLTSSRQDNSILLRKLRVKLSQRIGLIHLPPKIAKWRYKRGARSLVDNLNNKKEDVREEKEEEEEEDDDADVPGELEEVIELLLEGLRDKDTIVRWSSAKGIGRLCSRLPSRSFADNVVESVLLLFDESEGDGAWHGGCLALAELSRRGLLLPARLESVVPLIVRALSYDLRRGSNSVGDHVRDAACYVCWAFARAYAPEILAPFVPSLSPAMIVTAVFDREINCRRAAAAAFQENVGRQGNTNFTNGIEILTAADYFTLSNRQNSYLSVSLFVAQFEEYRHHLLNHLLKVKIIHWDISLRELTAATLSEFCKVSSTYLSNTAIVELIPLTLSENLNVRHGAVIAISSIIKGLHKFGFSLSTEMVTNILGIVPAIEKNRLYRGRGGEIMRGACNNLLESIANAKLPIDSKTKLRLLASIEETLPHPNSNIQKQAALSFKAFMWNYYFGKGGIPEKLFALIVEKQIKGMKDANAAMRRGSALALSFLSPAFLNTKERVESVINVLLEGCDIEADKDNRDAEARRNSATALFNLCETILLHCNDDEGMKENEKKEEGVKEDGKKIMDKGLINSVFQKLFSCMDDYSIDDRGDVGSWVRLAALESIEKLSILTLQFQEKNDLKILFSSSTIPTLSVPFPLSQFDDRKKFLIDDSEAKAHNSLITQTPISNSAVCSSTLFFSHVITKQVMCAILKQCVEKIDSLRLSAGLKFYNLLHSFNPPLPNIPQRFLLMKIFPENLIINWASANETYMRFVFLLALDDYRSPIFEGFISSIGSLSESVSKVSSACLVKWGKEQKASKNKRQLGNLLRLVNSLFLKYKDSNREICGLIKSFSLLLNANVYEFADKEDTTDIEESFKAVRLSVISTKQIDRVKLSLDVFISFCLIPSTKIDSLVVILTFLNHKYPKVRKAIAEKFYIFLQTEDSLFALEEETLDEIFSILSETVWDGDASLSNVKAESLWKLFKVQKPEHIIINKAKESKEEVKIIKEEGYASLVHEAGY